MCVKWKYLHETKKAAHPYSVWRWFTHFDVSCFYHSPTSLPWTDWRLPSKLVKFKVFSPLRFQVKYGGVHVRTPAWPQLHPDPSEHEAQAPNASQPLEIPSHWVLFLPLSSLSLGCVTALVLYYWNVWLWLVQQMKQLNANVWFPRGPTRFRGLQVFAEEEGF